MQLENTIQVDNELVYLNYRKIKNIYLTVNPNTQQIEVKLPFKYSLKNIVEFVQKNKNWIIKRRQRIANSIVLKPVSYIQDSQHYLFGNPYTLNINETTEKSIISNKDNHILLVEINPLEKTNIEQLINKLYLTEFNVVLKNLYEFYKNKISLYPQKIIIKKLKSRWGYCYPHKKLICMNLELAKYRIECIEYVYVHELVHLLEPSHNERFKRLLTEFLPPWKDWSKQLKQHNMC